MRDLPLCNRLIQLGAVMGIRSHANVALRITDFSTEYHYVRECAGITDFSSWRRFSIPQQQEGMEFLDRCCTGNLARLRFGRMLHTLCVDDAGLIIADCYIAHNDTEYLLYCETNVDDLFLDRFFADQKLPAGFQEITNDTVLLGIDGCKAWMVLRDIFGTDVLGLPYLSVEPYQYLNTTVVVSRAGKTSEFGYLVLAPRAVARSLFDILGGSAEQCGGGRCGIEVHDTLRLEGRFFNIFAEGENNRDPLQLGLQWMIDFTKESFSGRDSILSRRSNGLTHKMIGVSTGADREGFIVGATIRLNDTATARIHATCYSPLLERKIGLALFPVEYAYSGCRFHLEDAENTEIRTITMPPITPRSLTIKLDEM